MVIHNNEFKDEYIVEMGYTRKEFIQTFPAVVDGKSFQVRQNTILFEESHRQLQITLGENQFRKIGSLLIPKIMITFLFSGYSSEERECFLKRFALYYHKGGG